MFQQRPMGSQLDPKDPGAGHGPVGQRKQRQLLRSRRATFGGADDGDNSCFLMINHVQDGAPKIAKLVYKWLYGRYNYS